MKKSILALLAVLIGGTLYLRPEPFSTGSYRIFNEKQECIGHVRQNRFDGDRFDLFNEDWDRTGHLEKNAEDCELEDLD